jgi:transposase
MDNARPHVAKHTREFLNSNNINHFKSPAQSPDLNPIELVWQDLKVFLGEEVKPNNQQELVNGINLFWNTKVTVQYCNDKIDHLERVLKTVIQKGGKATGM